MNFGARTKYIFLTCLFILFCLGMQQCRQSNDKEEKNKNADKNSEANTVKENEEPKPVDRKYNDLARLIAGLNPEKGSVYEKIYQTEAWKQYAAGADKQWENILQNKVPKLTKWRDEELKKTTEAKGLLFYPFSGPDFLHAGIFFPEAEETVMIGLEPIGNIPDFDKITGRNTIGYYFNGIQRTLSSVLTYSFFRTLSMEVDLTGKVSPDIDGTLPIILLFMARTNHKVLYYEKMAISPEGKLIKAEDIKDAKKGKDEVYFVSKIAYQRADKPEERKTLYYLGVNLSNDPYLGKGGLNQRKDLMKYLESLKVSTTYIKSASYLMYKPYFSVIKDLILKKSNYLLQDDSGMALKNFPEEIWKLTFFGRYAGPIALFANYYQKDMQQAYADKDQVRPLPFGIGYQFAAGNSNLMLAEKK